MKNKKIINIPNALSFYRILSFPLVLYLAVTNKEQLFVIFLMINLFTDVLDGFIARNFNMQTEFGARLDSIADVGTYILAIVGIFVFKATEFAPHLLSFYIFILMLFASKIFSLFKFKRVPHLHLYSSKIGGYIQGSFFFILFLFNFYTVFYYIMIIWAIASVLEQIAILLISSEMKSNVKGLYWVIKNK